ncbi:MAG: lysophospholipase L1-like esterase [Planctomycetota bacterium]|jgi:lysophospholipase L1-like esterase
MSPESSSSGAPEAARRSASRKLLLAALASVVGFAATEGAARLALGRMGDGPPPIEISWEEHTGGSKYQLKLRDQLYAPHPATFFRLQPNLDLPKTSNPRIFGLSTNSHGLRGPEFESTKPAGTYRVLCLGDSCTFGSGAADAGTYPAQLQAALADLQPEQSVEAINSGVPGFSSYQGLAFLESEGLGLAPDAVTIAFGYNDSSPAKSGSKRAYREGLALSDQEFGSARKPPSSWAIVRLYQRLRPSAVANPTEDESAEPTKPRVDLADFRANHERMLALCQARGIPVILMVWPLRAQVAEKMPGDSQAKLALLPEYQALLREWEAQDGVQVLDLIPALDGKPEHFVDQVHLNAAGYGVVAQRLAAVLAR